MRVILLFFVFPFLNSGCNVKQVPAGMNVIDGLTSFSADSLAANIAVLASDAFEGRKPFSDGESKTIEFLKKKYIETGLEPGNGESYFQQVPMVRISAIADDRMEVSSASGSFTMKGREDYVIWTDRTEAQQSWNNDEVVFAGYGVVAPEYNWNDYAGLDVKGKIVLVLVNDPGFNAGDTTLFKGNEMTYYGRWSYKFEEAGRQGAKGCLIIHETRAASYPFAVVQNNWNNARLRLDKRGKTEKLSDIIGWLSRPAAMKILAAAGRDTLSYLKRADIRGFKAESLGVTLKSTVKTSVIYNTSNNVIGKITGSKYPDETIIYTAHWDHLGIGAPDDKGDSIYNGALDNASGSAGLIEIARAYRSLRNKPERTIVFLAVTAEEQGLWGSAYYAENPVYSTAKTIANINMDVLNYFGKTKNVVIIGRGQSELEDALADEVRKAGRVITFDKHPEAGSYYRSDHFNFAKVGIPALYMKYGTEIISKDPAYTVAVTDAYNKLHYHRPSDDIKLVTDLSGAIDDLQLLFKVGHRLAYSNRWPQWKQGSEFKAIRERDLNRQP